MAARSKPYALRRRGRNQIQHAVGTGAGLELGSDTRGAAGHNCRPPDGDLVVQPARSIIEPVLQSAVAEFVVRATIFEHVATKRVWRGQQRRQHAPIQQPWLLEPWGRRRRPFLRRTPAITFNH
jgi:hypothetical protein